MNIYRGKPTYWNSIRKKSLTYCVSKLFKQNHLLVVNAMRKASEAWENAADVNFFHNGSQDNHCNSANLNVLFDIRPVDVNGNYLARAFFPDEQRIARNLLIDNSAFELDPNDSLQLEGVLRHELGHVLGFRHEQNRPEAGVCFEDENFQPVTEYDRSSVMHYPSCNGAGDWAFKLSALDRIGSACLYGKGRKNPEVLNCDFKMPAAPVRGRSSTKLLADRHIEKGEIQTYGPIEVKRGTIFTANMTSVGNHKGDPDLYIRYLGQPTLEYWDCRPFLSSANEECDVEVPTRYQKVYLMIHGHQAGRYKLDVKYIKPDFVQ